MRESDRAWGANEMEAARGTGHGVGRLRYEGLPSLVFSGCVPLVLDVIHVVAVPPVSLVALYCQLEFLWI